MKEYQKPEVTVTTVNTPDVVTGSNGVQLPKDPF